MRAARRSWCRSEARRRSTTTRGRTAISVSYRASVITVTELDPLTLISSAYTTGSAAWEDDAVWLKDPANPQLNVRLSE